MKPEIRRWVERSGDGIGTKFRVLTQGELSASAQAVAVEDENQMVMGREQSDDRVVPEGQRKLVPTGAARPGGKAITANEQVRQLRLSFATADNPRGNTAVRDASLLAPPAAVEPKAERSSSRVTPTMMVMQVTMEDVASISNLQEAFKRVADNEGAPGPNRQSIAEVEEHLPGLLIGLNKALLDGSYRPGMIRRVWIPKPGGGQRGLGIPDVIDRLVQQAVLQILSPLYESTFHGSSHGFRPGRSCHTAIIEAQGHVACSFPRYLATIFSGCFAAMAA